MDVTMNCFSELFRNGMTMDEVRKILDAIGAQLIAQWDNLYGFRGSEEEEAEFYVFADRSDNIVGESVHLAGDEIGHFVVTPYFDRTGRLRYLRYEWIPGFGYAWEEYRIYRLPPSEPEFLLRNDDVFYYLTIWLPEGAVVRLKENYDPQAMNYIVQVFINDELKMIITEGAEKPWFYDKARLEAMIKERGARQTFADILEYLVKPVVLLGDRQ